MEVIQVNFKGKVMDSYYLKEPSEGDELHVVAGSILNSYFFDRIIVTGQKEECCNPSTMISFQSAEDGLSAEEIEKIIHWAEEVLGNVMPNDIKIVLDKNMYYLRRAKDNMLVVSIIITIIKKKKFTSNVNISQSLLRAL